MNRTHFAKIFNLLQRNRTRYTECVRITRVDGTVFRFTAHDKPLRIQEPNGRSEIYQSANAFSLTSLETSTGLVVSNMDIDGAIDDDAITENDLRNGLYDNANVELFLAYWSNSKVMVLPLRTSWIGEIQMDGPKYKVDLRGIAQRLAQTFIKGTSLECRYDFADVDPLNTAQSHCKLNASLYTTAFEVAAVESRDTFSVTAMDPEYDENGYQWGRATWTSGGNLGVSMEILRQYERRIQLFLPMHTVIEVGDTLNMILGCSKTYDACCNKFNNVVNFGGEPFLKGNDILMRYPSASEDETDIDELADDITEAQEE